jgi:site-specific DNA recombinase
MYKYPFKTCSNIHLFGPLTLKNIFLRFVTTEIIIDQFYVHESVEEILSTISFSAQTVNLYKSLLEKIFEKEDLNRRDEIQRVKKDIEKAEARRSNLQDLILDGTITPQDYQDMKGKVDKDLALFKNKPSGLMDQPSPYKTYISKTIPMLENLTGYYKQTDGQTKRKILSCIFSEKLVFEKGRVATTPLKV